MMININKSKWIKFILYFVVIVLVNLVSNTLFFRIDLTENKVYSLSDASTRLVSSLEEPLTVKVFLSENLPQPYNNLEQQMKDLLEEYSLEGNQYFNYSVYFLDQEGTSTDEKGRDLRTVASEYGIPAIQIQNVEQDEVKLQTVYMGMVIVQGDIVEVIPSLADESNPEYKITNTIDRISRKSGTFLAMTESIEVKLLLSPALFELSDEIGNYPDNFKSVVTKLNKANFNKVHYSLVDPTTLSEQQISSYGLNTINLESGSENNAVSTKAYAGVVVQYGDDSSTVNLLNKSLFGYSMTGAGELEQPLNDIIEKISGINQSIGYLSDHGTPALYSNPYGQQSGISLGNFNNLLSQTYNVKSVTLDGIPEDIKTLIIAGPTEPFTDWELFQIDQFLMKGGSLALFLDSFTEKMPSQQEQMYGMMPSYTPLDTGLGKLLKKYGVDLQSSYVMDEQCYVQRGGDGMGGYKETPIYFAPKISMDNIDNDVSFMKNIKGLIMLNTSPLELRSPEEGAFTSKVLFSSSDRSWNVSENINLYNPLSISPPSDSEKLSQPLAVLLEGSFNSFFEKNNLPVAPLPAEKDNDSSLTVESDNLYDTEGFFPQSDKSRIFVLGSSAALGDNILDSEGVSPNAMMVQNVIDYLNNREDYALMRSKGQGYNPLMETTPAAKRFIKTVNIIVLPILIIVFGLVMWFLWGTRRKKIEMKFREDQA